VYYVDLPGRSDVVYAYEVHIPHARGDEYADIVPRAYLDPAPARRAPQAPAPSVAASEHRSYNRPMQPAYPTHPGTAPPAPVVDVPPSYEETMRHREILKHGAPAIASSSSTSRAAFLQAHTPTPKPAPAQVPVAVAPPYSGEARGPHQIMLTSADPVPAYAAARTPHAYSVPGQPTTAMSTQYLGVATAGQSYAAQQPRRM
jgi:hypothetical protein